MHSRSYSWDYGRRDTARIMLLAPLLQSAATTMQGIGGTASLKERVLSIRQGGCPGSNTTTAVGPTTQHNGTELQDGRETQS